MAVINPESITEQQILANINTWLQTRESGSGWDATFAGANGTTVVELFGGSLAFLSYQARAARRESNSMTAKLQSSIVAISFTFGYPINRRRAARLVVRVTNTTSKQIAIPSTPLGHSGVPARPVSVLSSNVGTIDNPGSIPAGASVNLLCAVGEWVEFNTEAQRTYTDRGPIVSEDTNFSEIDIPVLAGRDILDIDNEAVELRVNNTTDDDSVINLTRYLELMNDDPISACIKTHINSLVILFGVRGGDSSPLFGEPSLGRPFDARYLLLPSQLGTDSDTFGIFGSAVTGLRVDSVSIQDRERPADSIEKVARVMPGYFAAKRRMVTPSDHQAIILSYPGILDAAVEAGTCATRNGDPLSEETIWDETRCTAAGGVWRDRVFDEGCLNVVSYILAKVGDIGVLTKGDLNIAGDPEAPAELNDRDTDGEEKLEAYLRDFQGLNSELLFRIGIPVDLNINIAIRTTGILSTSEKEALEAHVDTSILSQCFKLGGTFDISELTSDVGGYKHVQSSILQTPRNNKRLSWLGYFNYIPGSATITDYTLSDLPDQGVDRVLGSGYLFDIKAEKVQMSFSAKGKAETVKMQFKPITKYAIPA